MEVIPKGEPRTSYTRSVEPIWQLLESKGLVGPRTGKLLEFLALSWLGPLLHLGLAVMSVYFFKRVHEVKQLLPHYDHDILRMFFFGAPVGFIGMAVTLISTRAFVYCDFFVNMLEKYHSPGKWKAKATDLTFAVDLKEKTPVICFLVYFLFWLVVFGLPLHVPALVNKAANTYDGMSGMLVAFYLCTVLTLCFTSCGWHATMSWCAHLSTQMAASIGDQIGKCDDHQHDAPAQVIDWTSLARQQHEVSKDMYKLWRKASSVYGPYVSSVLILAILGIVLSVRCFRRNLMSGLVGGFGLTFLCIALAMAKVYDMSTVTNRFMSKSPHCESVVSKAMSKYGTMGDQQAAQHSYFVQYLLNSPTGARFVGVLVDYSLVVRLLAGSGTALSAIISGLIAFHSQGDN